MWNAKKEDDRMEPQFEKADASSGDLNVSIGDDHLASYRCCQGLLLLHLLTAVMLGPSLAAWVQVHPNLLNMTACMDSQKNDYDIV